MSEPLLRVENLSVEFGPAGGGGVRVVDGVDFSIAQGAAVGLVGESGSGKSITSLSILRLIPEPPGRIASGRILFQGRDLLALPRSDMPEIRGRDIAMIFQEPMSSLNPVMTIGDQIGEALYLHQPMTATQRRARILEMLRLVGIPNPEDRVDAYPHQFSGGMRQRVMIAMAVACNPKLLIADEPTTALDVTVQAQVLALIADIRRRLGTSVLLISHDLGIIAEACERVIVMYAGRVVEEGPVRVIFRDAHHPYTQALLRSIPRLDDDRDRLYQIPGSVPLAGSVKAGCAFRSRCPRRIDRCAVERPPLFAFEADHRAACWVTAAEAGVAGAGSLASTAPSVSGAAS